MKITIVLGAFFPVPPLMGGAVEKVWFALGQEFARQGHEVVQISRKHPQLPARETIDGVQHIRVSGFAQPRSTLWLKFLDLIYSLRVRFVLPRADILVTNTFWLPMSLRNARHGKVYVHVARYPKGQMRFYQHGARLQAPSQSVARAIIAEVPAAAAKVRTIPYPGPNTSDPDAPFSNRPRKILYVGRIHPEKGVHLLVEAFKRLPPEIAQAWKLSIVGPWENRLGGGGESYWKKLRALTETLNGAVEFHGAIFEAGALENEFKSARLFVYPSLAETGETFGLAPLEAMANGCAVLVSDLECFHDFLQDGQTGFLFEQRGAGVVARLQRKMCDLLQDEQALMRVAEAGWRRARKYSLGEVARRFLEDFQLLASDGRD